MKYLVIPLMLILLSCNSEVDERSVAGTWKVIEFYADMPDVSPEVISSARKLTLSSKYIFNAEKATFRRSDNEIGLLFGKYEILNEGTMIKMTFPDKEYMSTESYQIVQLNKNFMKWKYNYGKPGYFLIVLKKE